MLLLHLSLFLSLLPFSQASVKSTGEASHGGKLRELENKKEENCQQDLMVGGERLHRGDGEQEQQGRLVGLLGFMERYKNAL